MYVCNKRTKIIHTGACSFIGIMKNGTQNVDFKQAVDNGWHFCPHCSTVMKALKKEREQLDAFCRGKKHKKQQRRIEQRRKRVEQINRVDNLFFLLNRLEQEAARGA